VRITKTFLLLLLVLAAVFVRAAEPITLRFAVWDGDESLKVLKKECKNFEAAHPGIKVKLENVDYNFYFDKLLTQYAAGVAPDVAMLNPDFFQRYSSRGALMPLNELGANTPGFSFDDYYPSILNAQSMHDGKYKDRPTVYVLPRDIAPIAIVYYNKQALDKAGIPYPDGSWTWDFKPHPEDPKDFRTILEKLQKKDASGKVTGWGFVPDGPNQLIDTFVLGQGARYVDNPEDPKKLLFNDPRILNAYDLYSTLAVKDRLIPSTIALGGTSARQLFTQGKCAMMLSGIWITPQLRQEIGKPSEGGFDWDIALSPAYRNGPGGKPFRATPTGGSGYSIMAKTDHPKEAWELTRWMAGPHGMKAMAEAGIAQPAIRKLALEEPWIPGPNTPAAQQVPHNRIITDQAEPHVVFAPTGPLFKEVNDIARQPETLVFQGDLTAKEAFGKSVPIAQARLDTLRKELTLEPFNWTTAGVVGGLLAFGVLSWVFGPELGKKRTFREKREARAAFAFLSPWLFGLVFLTAGPMILSLIMSFSDWDIIRPARWRGLGNYNEALHVDPVFWKSITVTLIYVLVSVPLGIMFSLALALLLNTKVRGIAIWRTCFYIPALASPVATSLIWQKLFQPEGGLINGIVTHTPGVSHAVARLADSNGAINWLGNEKTALGSIIFMGLFGAGGGMLILLASLQGVPQFYYEAATLDGAGPWRRFRNVTVPLISPALFFTTITGFIGAFQSFTQVYVLTGGAGTPNNATMLFMLNAYNAMFRVLRAGYASALAWVLFLMILVFTIIQMQGNKLVHYEGEAR
jgi:ABC-type sugar transport system permease subunit/ABC-type glycerol-3-phosphate transport system substrate-binding protein